MASFWKADRLAVRFFMRDRQPNPIPSRAESSHWWPSIFARLPGEFVQ